MKKKGFTLIEVSLVLAIAGLIFAMVFAVLPGVLRSQRDAERRDDMILFAQKLKSFMNNNNRGAFPEGTKHNNGKVDGKEVNQHRSEEDYFTSTTWDGFYRDFFDAGYMDPDGEYYNVQILTCGQGGANVAIDKKCTNSELTAQKNSSPKNYKYTINVVLSAKCDSEDAIRSSNARRAAILYRMESSGTYCTDI